MSIQRRRHLRPLGAAGRRFARLGTVLAALALAVQLVFVPLHRAPAQASPSGIAATLKATFGAGAVLCLSADEGPAPGGHAGHGDAGCPLCQFAAAALALAAPDGAAAFAIIRGPAWTLDPSNADRGLVRAETHPAQARAPPFQA